MSDLPSAVGDLAQAGLTARAVEPAHGEGDGHTTEQDCLNCGSPLDGPYCRMCGQRARVHRTLGAFFHDLLHGVLHFEGKFWRTFPLLVWNPGKLTREYIDGMRASYVSPIALFLFVVFVTFAAISASGGGVELGDTVTLNGKKVSVAAAESSLDDDIAAVQRQRSEALSAGRPTAEMDDELAELQSALRTVDAVKNNDIGAFAGSMSPEGSSATSGGGASIDALWRKVQANPELLIYKLQSNAYKYSWLLIPISLPFLWLLFPFSRLFHLYDHTVFVTYSLSFMMLALAVATAGAMYDFALLTMIPILYAPLHMYWQVRGTYGTTPLGALWRTFLLLVFAWLALALWALALIGLVLGG